MEEDGSQNKKSSPKNNSEKLGSEKEPTEVTNVTIGTCGKNDRDRIRNGNSSSSKKSPAPSSRRHRSRSPSQTGDRTKRRSYSSSRRNVRDIKHSRFNADTRTGRSRTHHDNRDSRTSVKEVESERSRKLRTRHNSRDVRTSAKEAESEKSRRLSTRHNSRNSPTSIKEVESARSRRPSERHKSGDLPTSAKEVESARSRRPSERHNSGDLSKFKKNFEPCRLGHSRARLDTRNLPRGVRGITKSVEPIRRRNSRTRNDSSSRNKTRRDDTKDSKSVRDLKRNGHSSSISTSQLKRVRKDEDNKIKSSKEQKLVPPSSPTGDITSDDDLDSLKVEKWVRSAPEELYYIRSETATFTATDRAKILCEKFEKKLLSKAQAARQEAERLGEEIQAELAEKEKIEIQKQKEERLKNKERKKCAHSSSDSHDSPEDKSQEPDEKSRLDASEPCKHEDGEICDCNEKQSKSVNCQKSTESKCDKPKSCDKTKKCDKGCSKDSKKSSSNSEEEAQSRKRNKCKNNSKTSDKKGQKSSRRASSSSSSDSDSDSSDSDDSSDEECGISRSDAANRELEKKKKHPRRLHEELWHNDPGLMNDGPVCRCSAKARRYGIRHGYYPGETPTPLCDPFSTNKERLFHYKITISPPKNFLVRTPSVINHDGHEYIFEGFSIFSHYKLDLNLPPCKVIRFNIKYDVFVAEEKFPESFCVKELDIWERYVFKEILELLDLQYYWNEQGCCPPFHLMPRFVRQLPDNGKEILSMNRVLLHLLKNDKELIKEEELPSFFTVEQTEWQNFADKHKGMIVTKFGQKPSAIRVDQIDRDVSGQEADPQDGIPFPLIVHFGIRPPQLSYAGNTNYQRAWRRFVKYRHLLSNMAKPTAEEKRKLAKKEMKLQEMRTASSMKRDVTIAVSSKGFRTTGIFCDLVQHAMLIPVLIAHLRFHRSLSSLEVKMNYVFKNRYLLQLAMTHPSYRENFGTNPDHARNALTNCGIRQPEYGDRRIHYASTRKRGINTLINIMAKFGSEREMESEITHNERLEFLGDAVVEFVTSIHLFHMFPDLEEGGLATYRAAIVQNQHLAVLAQTLTLDQYMLYAHGSDLCHDSELRHAMANCFEALMGALFLDGGIEVADRVFGKTLYGDDPTLHDLWTNYSKHPLQLQEPDGDRHWIKSHNVLQKLTEFEDNIGVQFTHIRLLARAFTDRSLGYNNLSRGSNQRLEFLGDTVLQLISSEHLYRHFPDHHEGHLSLLRSSLVNNRTQSLVCDDLGMTQFAMRGDPKSEMKTKDRADLLEAFLGALYIDKGLLHCTTFCSVCFFPRLNKSIIKQEWNDPKSKLQQCCLTLRVMDGREPDIPVYKVTQSLGPTNTRIYIVAVYFRNQRLATAKGHSIQEAEMNAAAQALEESGDLFPQLHHQKSVMERTSKRFRFK